MGFKNLWPNKKKKKDQKKFFKLELIKKNSVLFGAKLTVKKGEKNKN